MNTEQRREMILERLKESDGPVSASLLAGELSVSRQIIVGDVALLRANGHEITATPRGYTMNPQPTDFPHVGTIACQHGIMETRNEMYTIVDFGGTIIDVTVEHTVYGELSGQLDIGSRYDVDAFCDELEAGNIIPLSNLTGGVHLHRVGCASEALFHKIVEALHEKSFVIE